MIIPFIPQVWPPQKINGMPSAFAEKDIEQKIALISIQPRSGKKLPARKNIFVFEEKRRPHDRYEPAGHACFDDLGGRAPGKASPDEDVGIDNNTHGLSVPCVSSRSI